MTHNDVPRVPNVPDAPHDQGTAHVTSEADDSDVPHVPHEGAQQTTVLVAAGVLVQEDRVLVTQRKAGSHLAGSWEFPGGKVRSGEDPRDALRRELREEVGIEATVGEILDVTFHRYAEKVVLLLFFEAHRDPGSPEPTALDVAACAWAREEELDASRFPPADGAVLAKVKARLRASR